MDIGPPHSMQLTEPKRLAPTKDVLIALFARSGNCCAFPGCNNHLIDDDGDYVANVCHIEAAARGGERFNENQTDEERRSYENLILLCYEHHIKTNNTKKYTVEKLKEMKRAHESKNSNYKISAESLNQVYNEGLNKIAEILERQNIAQQKHDEKTDQYQVRNQETLQTLLAKVSSIHEAIQRPLLNVEDLPEFESMKQFRKENKQESVLVVIKVIKDSKWEQLSTDTKFKLLINEGLAYLDLGRHNAAADCFLLALPLRPDQEDALSYAAVAYQIHGQPEKVRYYLEKTLAINPKNVNAFNILIQLHKGDPYVSIKEKIPIDLLDVPEISYNLALAARSQGLFNDAIELLQSTVDNSKKQNPLFLGALGSTILESITSDPFPYVTKQIGPERKTKIQYAIKVISEAVQIYEATDLMREHCDFLVNRGIAKRLLGDYPGALTDIHRANTIKQSDAYLTRHLMIAYLETGDDSKAFETCELLLSLVDEKQRIETLTFKANILQNLNRFAESLDILLRISTQKMPDNELKYVQHFIVSAYSKMGRLNEAITFLENVASEQPDEISSYLELMALYWNIGDKEKAKSYIEQAFSLVNDESLSVDLFELARFCFSAQDFYKAATIYEKITDARSYSELTKRLIQALFNSEQRKKALEICLNLEKSYGLDRFLTEAMCMIYESVDDVNSAISVCNKYLSVNPDDQVIIIKLAFLYDRLEIRDKLSETLKKIGIIDYTIKYGSLYQLARIYLKNGQKETGLQVAYETRRANYNIGNSHVQYFGLLTEFKLEKNVHVLQMVSTDCVVKLSDSGGSILSYIIETRQDVLAERGELNYKDPLAKKLIGLKIGDTVTLEKNFVEKPVFQVKEIITKHLFAFQETILLFSTRFINEPGIAVIDSSAAATPQERMAPILKTLDADEGFENQINNLYRAGRATIGMVASIRKANPIRTFYILSSDSSLGILPVWHINELANAKSDIDADIPLVIDIVSLTALAAIDSLFLLERLPNRKIVSVSTFDTITEQLRELRMSSEGMMTIGKVNGQYVRQEVTAEQIDQNIKYYEKLCEWIKVNCEFRPPNELLNLKASDVEELADLMGTPFHDSILIAKELKAILLSDDNVLRQLSSSEHQVKGIHSFLLSIYLLNKRLITRQEHTDLSVKLLSLNFKNLPCDLEVLIEVVKKSKYKPDHLFIKAAEGLSSPLLPEKNAATIAVYFLFEIYSDNKLQMYSSLPLKTIRLNLALPILNALFARPVHLRHLAQVMALRFHLLPEQLDELSMLIQDILKQ